MPIFWLTLLVILALIGAWHIFFPLLGGVIAISAIIFSLMVVGIIVFCFFVMLAFFLSGSTVFILIFLMGIWTFAAIILFPILFPLLLPLFIVYLFISHLLYKRRK